MAVWYEVKKGGDFFETARKYHIHPVTARIIRNRDVVGDEEIGKYLSGTIDQLYDPASLPGIAEAAALLKKKIGEGRSIRVVGDYDVDGICSSYILKRGLQALGGRADIAIPHRVKDGYGLNEHQVEEAHGDGVDVILTCDNGIAAFDQIALAKEYGMTVIVTDHHEIPYEETADKENGETARRYILPPADVIVDPKLPDCGCPFPGICGAVVAFKLIQRLFADCGQPGIRPDAALPGRERGVLDELLEFAAFATVGDMMSLQGENRILVRHGLALMQDSRNQGLRALMEVNGILPATSGKRLSAHHLGFVLGPCLNSSGRLDTASRAVELLESATREEAVVRASYLKGLNENRKGMTEKFEKEASALIEAGPLKNDRVLVVFLPDCHESLAGLVASRIRERYYKPVFILTRGEKEIKGSARSVEKYDIYGEMTKCRHFFTRFGGHKMAAGFSMREEDMDAFRREINAICQLTEEDLTERVRIDAAWPVSGADFSLTEELARLEPFGIGNPRPLFAQRDLQILSARVMGKLGNTLRFTVRDDGGRELEMMYFGDREAFEAFAKQKYGPNVMEMLYSGRGRSGGIRMTVVYYPEIDTYMGNPKLQIIMKYYK